MDFFQTDVLINFFVSPRRAEAVTWEISYRESGIQVVQKSGSVLSGWNFSHVIAGYNLWSVYNTAVIPTKRDRISSQPTGIL